MWTLLPSEWGVFLKVCMLYIHMSAGLGISMLGAGTNKAKCPEQVATLTLRFQKAYFARPTVRASWSSAVARPSEDHPAGLSSDIARREAEQARVAISSARAKPSELERLWGSFFVGFSQFPLLLLPIFLSFLRFVEPAETASAQRVFSTFLRFPVFSRVF